MTSALINVTVTVTIAVVKQWDAKIEDADAAGLQRRGNSAPVSMWDGRKDSNIGFILERHSTMKGLGSGGKCALTFCSTLLTKISGLHFLCLYHNNLIVYIVRVFNFAATIIPNTCVTMRSIYTRNVNISDW